MEEGKGGRVGGDMGGDGDAVWRWGKFSMRPQGVEVGMCRAKSLNVYD